MRVATEADLPRIVEIYNGAISARRSSADMQPAVVEQSKQWLEQHAKANRPVYVYEEAGNVIAWVTFERFYMRAAYQGTAEISIYVCDEHRGKGLGKKLLDQAKEVCPQLGIKNLLAYAFHDNEANMKLLHNAGFEQWGCLPGVAENKGAEYDLIIMGCRVAKG